LEEAELRKALARRHSADAVRKLNGLLSKLHVPVSNQAIDFDNLVPLKQQQPPPVAPPPVDPIRAWSLALDSVAVPHLSFNAAAVHPGQMSSCEDASMWDSSMVDQAQPGISTSANAGLGPGPGSGFDINAFALGVAPLLPEPLLNIATSATATAPLMASGPMPIAASVAIDDFDQVFSAASNLSALQLDEKDIPHSAQDYL
jgi:hypothetical protein